MITFCDNFGKGGPIFIILSLLHSEMNGVRVFDSQYYIQRDYSLSLAQNEGIVMSIIYLRASYVRLMYTTVHTTLQP